MPFVSNIFYVLVDAFESGLLETIKKAQTPD